VPAQTLGYSGQSFKKEQMGKASAQQCEAGVRDATGRPAVAAAASPEPRVSWKVRFTTCRRALLGG
jgi:hypothetical protein